MSQNGINDNQIEILTEGMIEGMNTNLQRLNLSKNQITDSGINSLVELCKQSNPSIQELYLGWN